MLRRKATFVPFAPATQHGLAYELYQLARIGLPVVGAQLAQIGMGVVDTIMAGHLSAEDLAAVALGANVMWPSLLFFWGILMAITPIFSQIRGAGRIKTAGAIVQQAFWLALVGILMVVFIFMNAAAALSWLGIASNLTDITDAYLRAAAWGMPGLFFYFTLRCMAEGMGYTKPAFIIAVVALLLKIPLNYIFMYGKFGAPALGGVGCGVATAIIMWLECLAMVVVAYRPAIRVCGWHRHWGWPDFSQLKRIISLGLPIGITSFLEVSVFSLVALLIGRLGAETIAAHQIAIIVANISFIFSASMGHASGIRIGFNVGGGAYGQARHTAQIVLFGAPVAGLVMGLIIFAMRQPLAELYTEDIAVLALATELLIFVAAFQVADAIQAASVGALRGYKITQFPLIVNLVAYWVIALPLGYYLAYNVGVEGYGVYGFWVSLSLALILVAVPLAVRLWWIANRPEQIAILSKR